MITSKPHSPAGGVLARAPWWRLREKEGPPVCRETRGFFMSRRLRKGISEFCELINHRTTQRCCGCPDQGDEKEEKEQSIPLPSPLSSHWSQAKQETLGNRGGTEGHTAGPTAAQGRDVGPRGSLESQPERAFMSASAKCGMCGVCGIWVEGGGPCDLSQPLPPAPFPTLIAHPGRAGPD